MAERSLGNRMKKVIAVLSATAAFVPLVAFAQDPSFEVLHGYIRGIVTTIINPLIGLLFAAAFVVGLWGGVNFILNADNEEARKKGKVALIWAIVGFFIMFSVGGILNVVVGTFGISLPEGQGIQRQDP
jgi:fructose-specific phosphotransferase system IIC component